MSRLFLFLNLLLLTACGQRTIEEVTIIGGGLMGSSTAWQLARSGAPALLIEQQDSIYTSGSSLGEARIVRSFGPKNDIWSYLHNRSVAETQELINYLNEQQAGKHHMKDVYTTSPVNYVRHIKQEKRITGAFEGQQDSFQYAATPIEGQHLFNVALPDSSIMLREYKLHSGTLNPQALIRKLHQAVRHKGNRIWYRHRVKRLQEKEGLYEIELRNLNTGKDTTIWSKKVVSAAGPYTGQLLKEVAPYVDSLVYPQRVFLAFFQISRVRYDTYSAEQRQQLSDAYPVINSTAGTRAGSCFAMIERREADGYPTIKIGGHFQRSDIDNLDQVWQKELNDDEILWGHRNTLKYLKLLQLPIDTPELQYVSGYSCVYSLSSSEVPYVTPLLDAEGQANPNLLMLSAMSGVGAKGAMSYGRLAADYILQQEEQGAAYQRLKAAMGFERLLSDLE